MLMNSTLQSSNDDFNGIDITQDKLQYGQGRVEYVESYKNYVYDTSDLEEEEIIINPTPNLIVEQQKQLEEDQQEEEGVITLPSNILDNGPQKPQKPHQHPHQQNSIKNQTPKIKHYDDSHHKGETYQEEEKEEEEEEIMKNAYNGTNYGQYQDHMMIYTDGNDISQEQEKYGRGHFEYCKPADSCGELEEEEVIISFEQFLKEENITTTTSANIIYCEPSPDLDAKFKRGQVEYCPPDYEGESKEEEEEIIFAYELDDNEKKDDTTNESKTVKVNLKKQYDKPEIMIFNATINIAANIFDNTQNS